MVLTPVEAARIRAEFNKKVLRPLSIIPGSLVNCVDSVGVFQGISLTRDDSSSIVLLLTELGNQSGTYKNLSNVHEFSFRGNEYPVRTQMHTPSPEEIERRAAAERELEEERNLSIRRMRGY
ncbi:hypothetical protein HYT57_00755 [Candidatus Woesearchaeota archaeon]|nr:hypothetical protein [Candidatus Woesearchaeota archaeon]